MSKPRPPLRDRLHSERCARALKALADPERLRIIQCLQGGAKHVGEVCKLLGLPLANVSHHLGVLRHAGLVCDKKQGKYVSYSLAPDVFAPSREGGAAAVADFGCCRLDLGTKRS